MSTQAGMSLIHGERIQQWYRAKFKIQVVHPQAGNAKRPRHVRV